MAPDDVRAKLKKAGDKRRRALAVDAAAQQEMRPLVRAAFQADVSISEIERLSSLTRPTIYKLVADLRE